jgi:hypothetical protein
MARPRISQLKRQREQAKRDRQQRKTERRDERKRQENEELPAPASVDASVDPQAPPQ